MQICYRYFSLAIVIASALMIFPFRGTAQDRCQDAAAVLSKELLKTASGKNQLKGSAARNFQSLTDSVKLSAANTSSQLECFMQLTRLMQPLRDNHLHFSENAPASVPVDSLRSESWNRNYRATPGFINFPRVNLSLDSLEKQLKSRDENGWEGIYYLENFMKIGIFKSTSSDTLTAVILETYLPQWERGQVMAWFWPRIETGMASVYAHYYDKNWNFHRNIRLINKRIPLLGFRRTVNQEDHVNLGRNIETYSFKRMENNVDYLRLGSFSADPANQAVSRRFVNKIKDSLSGNTLLIDLRNNGGGATKVSKHYMRIVRKQSKKKKVFLLMNNSTVSEAECFLIKLLGRRNIYMLGETTRGMIAYGNNTGLKKKIGNAFTLYITDMKGTAKEIALEDKGVEPEIKLDPASSWEQQVLKFIREKEALSK